MNAARDGRTKSRQGVVRPGDDPGVAAFLEAMWLEDGLSDNTLRAYRQDLSAFDAWLKEKRASVLDRAHAHDIEAWFAAVHHHSKATTANRRLATLRRYFQWALRLHRVDSDPA